MNFRELSKAGAKKLSDVENAEYDAQKLLSYVIGSDMLLAKALDVNITAEQECIYDNLISRRAQGEPLQYIIGEAPFMGLMFYVDKSVLIPRFDTETVVCACLDIAGNYSNLLDLCTGSGAIAVSLKHMRQDLNVSASDISPGALTVAKRNADRYCVNISFFESDMFENIDGVFDIIVCNPPYISENELKLLSKEVKQEPISALAAGADGLMFYRRLFKESKENLKESAYIVCELGFEQCEAVCEIAKDNGFSVIDIKKDLNNIPRALIAQLKEK
jgi:release factor glutamine methyltransferase